MTETEVHELVIMTAIKLFNLRGFANVSMNDIVRETGVSKGGVYWHFKNKDEVIQAVLDHFLNAQLEAINAMMCATGTASEKLRRMFQFSGSDDLPSPLEFYALAARDEALLKRMSAYFHDYRQQIAAVIKQGIEEGEFAPCDVEAVATTVVSFLEGTIIVGVAVLDRNAFSSHLNNAIEFILRGLK